MDLFLKRSVSWLKFKKQQRNGLAKWIFYKSFSSLKCETPRLTIMYSELMLQTQLSYISSQEWVKIALI